MEFSRPEYWSGQPFPSPGDLPNPGIKPRSPSSRADSLPAEPQGKPKNTGVGSLSLLQWIFPTQELNQGLLHCRWILYQLSYKGTPKSRSRVQLFGTPWIIQSLEFSRPEYWSGQPFASPGDLPNPGVESRSPALQADSLPVEPRGKPRAPFLKKESGYFLGSQQSRPQRPCTHTFLLSVISYTQFSGLQILRDPQGFNSYRSLRKVFSSFLL